MRFLLFLLFVLSSVHVSAQTPELDQIFNQALSNLASSANNIDSLRKELSESRNYVNSLQLLSEEQKQTLNQQATTLEQQSISLQNINIDLTNTSKQLIVSNTELKRQTKFVHILAIILILRTLAMLIGYILYARGVKLPRWVDILL